MFPRPEQIIAFLVQSAGVLSTPVRAHAQVMVLGAHLARFDPFPPLHAGGKLQP